MFTLHSFENYPIDSVTYIISNPGLKEALIIDPGTENDTRIINYLSAHGLDLKFIFLTHEHFDHILGVNFLRENFPNTAVITSLKTSERLSNPKKNLAIFHNQINLVVKKADIIVEEGAYKMIGLEFEIFYTPGHTDSSISLKICDSFFSGDFLLQGTRIVTNLPTGSKKDYQQSLEKYKNMLKGIKVFPGHGGTYTFE
ncbi:MBL fold metallo-hydrolase [Elizabethkingia meningoseptica]|uniref:MBL fold metallo-hydrolase n=1 Tax=Elizabethkingia meningoseptica TaxID=238 RepID=UPI000332C6CF|nr:MBL fold metallo-hydrolase [Elizabethkingia meningoseptica]AQX04988.1 MBL fold metallo-hydrolase [Elizabethkingia meningoseptica]AQX47029.1 MBL fold metallo-hydrolase [Elizabethkingia meningoseptica]EOR28333.1 Beta-lactamase domain protein [Elizabethkingia meningoseptica ATCC 13253 = NBRC 12535]KUY17996.1 MBL fold metallo-hydrolase [Elizabethkingia meningoseptica]MDE5489084.1 MBL fold metallo-hydrolase [Elizabethkingia meningoseptica]